MSEDLKKELGKAVKILKAGGCREVYLFGSAKSGKWAKKSDLDLAVRGCPPGKFFPLLGKLLLQLKYPVDLINLDNQDAFSRFLENEGELFQID